MQLTQLKRTANQREVGQSSWVKLRRRRYRHFADATQLNSTSTWVEVCRYKRALTQGLVLGTTVRSLPLQGYMRWWVCVELTQLLNTPTSWFFSEGPDSQNHRSAISKLRRLVRVRGEAVHCCENPSAVDDNSTAEKTKSVEKSDVPRSWYRCRRGRPANTAFWQITSTLVHTSGI